MRLTTVFALMVALLIPAIASAGLLTIDVKALPGAGYSVNPEGTMVTILDAHAVVNFQVYGVLAGTNTSATDDTLTGFRGHLIGAKQGGGTLTGNLALPEGDYAAAPYPCYIAPFTYSGAADGVPAVQDLNGDGLLDIGGLNDAVAQGHFNTYASTAQVGNGTYLTGLFNFAVATSPADLDPAGTDRIVDEVVTWQRRNSTTAISGKVDGTSITGTNWATWVTIGPGVQITHLVTVPEPSTIALLGMSALALIFIRRRK